MKTQFKETHIDVAMFFFFENAVARNSYGGNVTSSKTQFEETHSDVTLNFRKHSLKKLILT